MFFVIFISSLIFIYVLLPTRILTRAKTIETCESDVHSSPDTCAGSSHNNEQRKRGLCGQAVWAVRVVFRTPG